MTPIGTAPAHDAFLLVEVPLPWPKDAAAHPALAAVADVAAGIGARVQLMAPPLSSDGRIVLYRRDPSGPFRRYERVEARASWDRLAEAVRSAAAAAPTPTPTPGADTSVLVCTHGARDRCCGALGMSLFASMKPRAGVRISRTSHLGGHRFAPTALVLPEGTAWAWLDDAVLDAVLDRSRPPSELLPYYRGSAGIGAPVVQAAEAAVFGAVGWSWLDEERTGRVVEDDGHHRVVRIESTAGAWQATVVREATVAQPVCGDASPGPKRDDVLRVVDLRRLDASSRAPTPDRRTTRP